MINIVHNCDCMDLMRDKRDGFYDLAMVDLQTGQGEDGGKDRRGITHKKKNWDQEKMPAEYFSELFRISKNQIIWQGGFYIEYLYSTSCWIVWDKKIDNCDFGDFELAWTSFGKGKKIYRLCKTGGRVFNGMFIHPCQKPVILYKWQLQDFAQPGWKILDSHVGSGSPRIACWDLGFDFEGCELDPDYWQAQEDRFKTHINQPEIFDKQEIQEHIYNQENLL